MPIRTCLSGSGTRYDLGPGTSGQANGPGTTAPGQISLRPWAEVDCASDPSLLAREIWGARPRLTRGCAHFPSPFARGELSARLPMSARPTRQLPGVQPCCVAQASSRFALRSCLLGLPPPPANRPESHSPVSHPPSTHGSCRAPASTTVFAGWRLRCPSAAFFLPGVLF